MPDIADLAQAHIEREAPYLMASRKRVTHVANGECHNCYEPVPAGLFCDAFCREDFEKREARGLE